VPFSTAAGLSNLLDAGGFVDFSAVELGDVKDVDGSRASVLILATPIVRPSAWKAVKA